jgi:hypothetical protein
LWELLVLMMRMRPWERLGENQILRSWVP